MQGGRALSGKGKRTFILSRRIQKAKKSGVELTGEAKGMKVIRSVKRQMGVMLLQGGQILSGIDSKSAVGVTSLAEGLTCFVGIVTYILVSKSQLDLRLAPFIVIGAVLSVPFSVKSVKIINEKWLKLVIAVLTIILGLFTLSKVLISLKG